MRRPSELRVLDALTLLAGLSLLARITLTLLWKV